MSLLLHLKHKLQTFPNSSNLISMAKLFITLLTITLLLTLSTSKLQTLLQLLTSQDPCKNEPIEPIPSLTLICYENNITQIHINGGQSLVSPIISPTPLFSSLSTIKTLKVLSLVNLGLIGELPSNLGLITSLEILNISSNYFHGEIPGCISSLVNLQSLVLDNNSFSGKVPPWLSLLRNLAVLSLNENSLSGSLPDSISEMKNLRVISVSRNNLSGEVPDLHGLENLQVLDLGENNFGPHFPKLHIKLVMLVLRKNKFSFGLPTNLNSSYRLRKLDVSSNRFAGPFFFEMFSFPFLSYIDISRNMLTGKISENTSCNDLLAFVDISSNRFTGRLPTCLKSNSSNMIVKYNGNCLLKKWSFQRQHKLPFCHNEALAVNVMRQKKRKKNGSGRKVVLSSSLVGGFLGVIVICGMVVLVIKKLYAKRLNKSTQTRLIMEKMPPAAASTIKMLSDARYISETMKLGALGLPPYRTFSFDEVKEATSNFSELNLIGEGSHGKVYKGTLIDGTLVAIRSLIMRKRNNIQSFTHQVELVSKLRHRHLISSVGHCFECYPDDSSVSRIFLIFEFVSNGTLRGHISEGLAGQKFTWNQRIAAAIGVASGIQFLHTGIVPGLFSNNLRITNVLLDHDLRAKLSNHNLPLLADQRRQVNSGSFSDEPNEQSGVKHWEKDDIYDLGVILLEIIVGRAIRSESDITVSKDLLQVSLKMDEVARRSIMDPAIHKECTDESMKTMMEICLRCLSNDLSGERPSVEDVLWNLQFAAQVQEETSFSNQGSPMMCTDPK